MGKTSYRNIENLVKNLQDQLQKLNGGKLSLDELETLVENAKEVYERLVVIRYKAYENFGEPAMVKVEAPPRSSDVDTQEVPDEFVSKPFDFTTIEDDSAKKVSEPKIVRPGTIASDFDFSEDVFDLPKKEEDLRDHEEQKNTPVKPSVAKPQTIPLHEKFLKEDEAGLNQRLGHKPEEPLRKKIAKSVTDLRSEIGIGKKFEYINFLFGGDAKAYEVAIDSLNATQSREEAKEKLHELGTTYQWNLEEKSIVKFIELVERKFK